MWKFGALVFALMLVPGWAAGQEPRADGRSLTEWTVDLRNASPEVRMRAVTALGTMGTAAIPPLVEVVLADRSGQVGRHAASALSQMGPDAALPFIQLLNDPRPAIRVRASYTLGLFPQPDDAIVAALARALSDPEWNVRINAARRFEHLGPSASAAVPALLAALHDTNFEIRNHAGRALMRIGPIDVTIIPGLIDGLREKDPFSAQYALIVIGHPATGQLVAALGDSDPGIRAEAAGVLGKIRPTAPGVAAALIALLERDRDGTVRRKAAYALLDLGGTDDTVMFAFVRALAVGDEIVREISAGALGALYRVEPAVLNGLVHALKDPGWGVRQAAARSLAVMAPPYPDVIRALVEALRDEYQPAMAAVDALARIGRPAETALRQAAQDPDRQVKWRAEEALRTRARKDPTNISALLTILQSGGDDALRAAGDLGRLGQRGQAAVPDLVRMLGDKNAPRGLAARALRGILPKDSYVIAALAKALTDPEPHVRIEAALTVAKIGPSAEMLPALRQIASETGAAFLNVPGFRFEIERAIQNARS